jgi:glucans biosynthesis protein C
MTIGSWQQVHSDIAKNRLTYIDNLKALVIILVVIVHVAATYSGIAPWFYIEIEHKNLDIASFYAFWFILSFSQAFFMSLFFFIAAYFVPPSLDKKGTKKFIKDRLFRLGIPTAIFIFLIYPVVEKMARPHINLLDIYQRGITSFRFLSWTGPMWFAAALLMFSIAYIPINQWFIKLTNKYSFSINIKNVLALVALITITAFAIRLIYPIPTSVLNFMLCFFAAYIFMFSMGIIAYRKNIIENISYSAAKKWFTAAFVFGLPFWILVMYFGINRSELQHSTIRGGWNFPAFGYALWESFFCVAITIGLIGIFKKHFNTQNALQKSLSDNAFGVYVFHPLTVVATSVLLKNVSFAPFLKFILVVLITVPVSFIFASLIRKVRILQKLFS